MASAGFSGGIKVSMGFLQGFKVNTGRKSEINREIIHMQGCQV